jgi:hypothetical protein
MSPVECIGGRGVLGRQIQTAEPFVSEPSAAEVEVTIGKLKRYKAPGSDQISAELIPVGGGILYSEIHKLIMMIWNKEELPHQWKESVVIPIHKQGNKTDCSNYRGISLLPTSYKILSNILISRLIPYADEIIGDHQCGFRRTRSTTDQTDPSDTREKVREYNGTVPQLFIDFKKAYYSFRREVLYNILIEFATPRKLVELIKMCLNETYSRVRISKNLSEKFTIQNGLKQGDTLSPLLFKFSLEYAIRRVQENQEGLILNDTSAFGLC